MTKLPALLGAALALPSVSIPAQTSPVVISEINFTELGTGDQWIELFNRSNAPVDISSWSVYHATATPFLPGNYWFAFPTGTVIPAASFVRVHWYQPIPAMSPPEEIYTGNSNFHFLFGLGAENLSATGGAIALLTSQQNALMNSPSVFADWVSWGQGTRAREDLAALAGLWIEGRFVLPPEPTTGQDESIARSIAAAGQIGDPPSEWFRDASPTPLMSNAPGATTTSIGQACQFGPRLLGPPTMSARSFPVPGNRDYRLSIANTQGLPGETVILVFSNGQFTSGPPSPCPIYIDPFDQIGTLIQSTQPVSTEITGLDFSTITPFFGGVRVFVQAAIVDVVGAGLGQFHGATNALDIIIGLN